MNFQSGPRCHESDLVRRVPGEHLAPVAAIPLGVAFVPASAGAGFDEDGFKGHGGNVMRGGPPGFHLFDEDGKRAFDGGFNVEGFSYGGFFCALLHVFLWGIRRWLGIAEGAFPDLFEVGAK